MVRTCQPMGKATKKYEKDLKVMGEDWLLLDAYLSALKVRVYSSAISGYKIKTFSYTYFSKASSKGNGGGVLWSRHLRLLHSYNTFSIVDNYHF